MPLIGVQLKLQQAVARFFGSLSRYAIGHPRSVLALALVVTLAVLPGLPHLKLRTDGHALVSPSAPEVIYDREIRGRFGIEDNIVVLIHSLDAAGIFNPATVQRVRDLTAEIRKLPGLAPDSVMSLATEPSFRFRPGTLANQKLLEPPLTTKEELELLREDLRRIELYTGTLVSADGQCTVILIGTPTGADRTRLYQQVQDIVAAEKRRAVGQAARLPSAPLTPGTNSGETPGMAGGTPAPLEEIAVTGAPVAEALLGIHILEDLGVPNAWLGASTRGAEKARWKLPASFYELRLLIAQRIGLVPVAVLVMMLVFLVSFRNALAMLLPLPGVLATLVFVFGLMGWLGVPIYLTTAVMPVLLTATGVTNDVYLFNRYFSLLRERPGRTSVELLHETFDRMASPVANTSLTTGIGFLSFGLSPLGPVRAFGLCTGVGVLFGLLFSLTVLPALLALIDPAWLLSRRSRASRAAPGRLADCFARLGRVAVRWRWWVAGAALVTAALTPLGLKQLVVQDSWLDGFDPSSDFRRTALLVNQEFHGMHLLFVSANAPQVLTGTVPASELSPGTLVLPVNLVQDFGMLAGSPITLTIDEHGPAAGATNASGPVIWKSHIEMLSPNGDRIYARVSPIGKPANFWPALAQAGQARYEIGVHTQVRPDLVRTLGDLGGFIRERRQYAVGGVLSPYDYVTTTRFMVRPNDPAARRLPDSAAEIKLMWDYYALARGQHRLSQVVDTNYWQSLTTVFLKDANFVDTAKLMSDIRGYEREHLTAKGIKLGFAGDVALSQSLIQGIVTTQMQSLIWSLVGIYVITSLLGGSFRWGVYCVLPSALAVLVKLALMGWFGIPLGVATSMFAAMTLGIGVNCAIQLLESYGQSRAARTEPEAINRAMALTGPPALVNTLAVSLGFGVLMLSQVPANARLGLLVVLGLVECFFASLLLLPVLLHWWPLRRNGVSPVTDR